MASDPVYCKAPVSGSNYMQPTAVACATTLCTPGGSIGSGGSGPALVASAGACSDTLAYVNLQPIDQGQFYCNQQYYSANTAACNAQPLVIPEIPNLVTPALQGALSKLSGVAVWGFGLAVAMGLLYYALLVFIKWVRRATGVVEDEVDGSRWKLDDNETIVDTWRPGDGYDPDFGDYTFGDTGISEGGYDPFGEPDEAELEEMAPAGVESIAEEATSEDSDYD